LTSGFLVVSRRLDLRLSHESLHFLGSTDAVILAQAREQSCSTTLSSRWRSGRPARRAVDSPVRAGRSPYSAYAVWEWRFWRRPR